MLFTADGSVPLVRYHIADDGGLVGHEEMLAFCARHGFDPLAEVGRVTDRGAPPQPFAYVFGRSLFTVSFFGANIYPENVTVGLEQQPVSEWVTGRFVLEVTEDADHDRHLSISVELAPGVRPDPGYEPVVAEAIRAALSRLNSEFANYVPERYQTPRIELRPAGDPRDFPPGVKHRYTRRPGDS